MRASLVTKKIMNCKNDKRKDIVRMFNRFKIQKLVLVFGKFFRFLFSFSREGDLERGTYLERVAAC